MNFPAVRVCIAQTNPVIGDIQRNIEHHKKFVDKAVSTGSSLIIFPELSLTGYEPALAETLATQLDDERFDDFQRISDTKQITIGVGVPIRKKKGINIGMILFQPQQERKLYSKKFLHPDEEAFFVSGDNINPITVNETAITLAICYEISIPEHTEAAAKTGSGIYIASVAKSVHGIDKALKTLAETARKYSMTVMMSNCIGISDGHECAGKSSVWNNKGLLVGQLDGKSEAILVVDTKTEEVIQTAL